jgi:hypothetical protein
MRCSDSRGLAAGEPEERKAVVRAFLQEIRIEKTTGQAVLRWRRLPRVGEPLKLVELRGLELLTPRLPEPQVFDKPAKDKKHRSAKRGKR